jgi:hypothetical protein
MKIIKKNPAGETVFQYKGEVLQRAANSVTLEAFFGRDDLPFLDVVLKKGDRFVETFYTDRWYNIFEIHDRDDGKLKGWYCNIGRPAVIEDGAVSYVDLALDLWVSVDGKQTTLDEDEFAALDLDEQTARRARDALIELQEWIKSNGLPG